MATIDGPPGQHQTIHRPKPNGPTPILALERVHVSSSAAKRNFEFITITDPKQARNKENKRSVRSHVMFDHAQQKRRSQADSSGVQSRRPRRLQQGQRHGGEQSELSASLHLEHMQHRNNDYGLDMVISLPPGALPRFDESSSETTGWSQRNVQQLSRYYQALLKLKRSGKQVDSPQNVLALDEGVFELVWETAFVRPYLARGIGNPVDCFFIMPQSRNLTIGVAELKMWCTRRFGTKAMGDHWVPALSSSRASFLGSVVVGIADMDVFNGVKGESAHVVAVKTEVIQLVNERLNDPSLQLSDITLISIIQLYCSDLVSGNSKVLDIHEYGMTKIVSERGGLRNLGVAGYLSVGVFCIVFIKHVLLETQPTKMYLEYISPKVRTLSTERAIPESPVYCPRGDFYTMVRSKWCSEQMYELLCDMRDLTDRFFEDYLNSDHEEQAMMEAQHMSSISDSIVGPSDTMSGFQAYADQMLTRVRAIPALRMLKGKPTSYTDWMFEATRIAALVFTTAMASRAPFSKAAAMIDHQTSSFELEGPADPGAKVPILVAFKTAAVNSNAHECWGDISGTLYWCLLIMTAAARKKVTEAGWSEDNEFIRRYLAATTLRLSILLLFEHPTAIMVGLRRLNNIQEFLAREARKPPSDTVIL